MDIIKLYDLFEKERKKKALIDDKESNEFKKWKERYELRINFEKYSGIKAYHKGKETNAFLQWLELLEKKDMENIKYIVRFFPDDSMMRCIDFPVKKRVYDKSNRLVWKYENNKEYYLDKIGYTMLFIPVYLVLYNKTNSIPYKLCKQNDNLVAYGCNSFDTYNKHHSAILHKGIKQHLGKMYGKATVYLVIYLFFFCLPFLPFLPFILIKFWS